MRSSIMERARPSSHSIRSSGSLLDRELRAFSDSINVIMLPIDSKYFLRLPRCPVGGNGNGNGNDNHHDHATKVSVTCPKCKTQARLSLNHSVFNQDNISTVSVPKHLVCEHEFQAFIDQKGSVRGYQSADYIIAPEDCTSCDLPSPIHLRLENVSTSLRELRSAMS